MAFRVRFTTPALRRLKNSISYLNDVLCQPGTARRLHESVLEFVEELEGDPRFLVVDHEASQLVGECLYRKRIGRYKLLFMKDSAAEEFVIVSFIHDLQDARAFLAREYEDDV